VTPAAYSGEQAPPSADKLGGAFAWFVWLISVVFVVYYFSIQTGYAIVNPSLAADLQLTPAQIGVIAATYTWVFAFCQFASGALLDRFGARKIIPAAIGIVTAGIFVFAHAGSFATLLLSQVIIAVGACSGFVGAGYVGGRWFGMAKFSFMFGLVQFVASFFSAFNQNLLAKALETTPWRDLFFQIGLAGIALFIAAAIFVRNPEPITGPPTGVSGFLRDLAAAFLSVVRIPHVWIAAFVGAFCFGTLLSLGVVWGPKLFAARGIDLETANWLTSWFWFGLAAGCATVPWLSDKIQKRKIPIIAGVCLQLAAFLALVYLPSLNASSALALAFAFGVGNAAHMLAFSTAADVVPPSLIGTSAAFVNGIMFLIGGAMIARPGVRIHAAIEQGLLPSSPELAAFAARPLIIALILALVLAFIMRETYRSKS
jgi:MFS family permease